MAYMFLPTLSYLDIQLVFREPLTYLEPCVDIELNSKKRVTA